MPTTVLLAGATGMMGRKILRNLTARGAGVRALVRPGRAQAADELRRDGADPVEGDLNDPDSLRAACRGADVVVSAVQGLRDVIVDGQANLLRAAEAEGVGRMIPSDYSVDLFKLAEGENRNLDLRREFNRLLDASRVRGTSVLNGAFAEMLLRGFGAAPDSGTFTYWGDGEQVMDFTTTDDAAAFIAEAALDRDAPRVLRVAGDTLTSKGLHEIFERAYGRKLEMRRAGGVDDLARKIEQARMDDPGGAGDTFPAWQQLQYLHNMVSGRAKLDPLDNARYPGLECESVEGFLNRARGEAGR